MARWCPHISPKASAQKSFHWDGVLFEPRRALRYIQPLKVTQPIGPPAESTNLRTQPHKPLFPSLLVWPRSRLHTPTEARKGLCETNTRAGGPSGSHSQGPVVRLD
ncbi:hypothetical protein PGTUg99_033800 [Puccinia graminis f. sp. tritici]|uniref:Uncharacterized protein n=1 Tax=Puccinia graminis f. sp. tritici TaxID=56615 RepID=A0A5B0MHK5_PUCGR|nr:hypothetical protein PGTUg99_033800 [Puccinia graminis f. sp. tritici]